MMIEKLSQQIELLYGSYEDITKDTSAINGLNDVGIDAVGIPPAQVKGNLRILRADLLGGGKADKHHQGHRNLCRSSIESIAEQTNLLSRSMPAIEAGKGR